MDNYTVPTVVTTFGNGNLLPALQNIDGLAAFIGTGSTGGNLNKVFSIQSLSDAESQGITAAAEPVAHRHLTEFYAEIPGTLQSYWMLLANTVLLADMVNKTNPQYAQTILTAGAGNIEYLIVFKSPANGYNGGTGMIDEDVENAITNAGALVADQNTKFQFLRVLIEGRVNVATETAVNPFAPNTMGFGAVGVILGGSQPDGSASVGSAAGRAVAYDAATKIGQTSTGPLQLSAVYIGSQPLAERLDIATLAGLGYITFVTYPAGADMAGFFFGFDYMASTDDYRYLTNGAVLDAAARISSRVYVKQLLGKFKAAANGTMDSLDAQHLEDTINAALGTGLAGRVSSVTAKIDRTVNIVQTNTIALILSAQPLGYAMVITQTIGLSATA